MYAPECPPVQRLEGDVDARERLLQGHGHGVDQVVALALEPVFVVVFVAWGIECWEIRWWSVGRYIHICIGPRSSTEYTHTYIQTDVQTDTVVPAPYTHTHTHIYVYKVRTAGAAWC